jgi:hypothetical protein
MKPETPASGISQICNYTDLEQFRVNCSCQDTDHDVVIEVSTDNHDTTITHYVTARTDNWTNHFPGLEPTYENRFYNLIQASRNLLNTLVYRLKVTRDVWFRGQVRYEASIILDHQTAVNYAQCILTSIEKQKK